MKQTIINSFLGSSTVEGPAVNRNVAGSNPVQGAENGTGTRFQKRKRGHWKMNKRFSNDKVYSDFIQADKLIKWERLDEAQKSSERYRKQALWLYGIKAIISDCLSEDQGSIPCRVVKKHDK